ncbi:uncharacterized protein LOC119586641 [Penaeus monodon]|uniref:uncharacterized protein LOC119586641 n=1 Tax=Penaeus monodon TaxID=6687 RepID=UPI0018A71FA2|nr:uncharacterized protein LOC119586641 [Penaeus monodon]
MLTFFVCRLPPWIFLLVPQVNDRQNDQGRRTYSYIHYSLHTLSLCAPAINPFLYALLQQSYQQHLPANLRCMLWIISISKRAKPVAVTPATLPSCGTLTTLPDVAGNSTFAKSRHEKPQTKRCPSTTWCVKDVKDVPGKEQGNPRLPTVEEERSIDSVRLDRGSSVLVRR